MQQDNDVIKQWSQSAPYWEKHRRTIVTMFGPVTEALIEDAQIAGGHTVLDVATGPGEPALSIAKLAGPEGRVIGIDPAPEMVAAAKRAAGRADLRNAHFQVAFADHLPFAKDSFDAVVSRFGVMFFPSPLDGLREMVRVLRPRRKLAIAVWHFVAKNPFHYVFSQVVEKFADSPSVAPDSPDAFRFATPGKLRKILDQAGAAACSERLLQFKIEAPLSVEDFWTLRTEMSEKLRGKLAKLSREQLAQVREQVIDGLRAYSTDHGLSFPAEVLVVSGRKP